MAGVEKTENQESALPDHFESALSELEKIVDAMENGSLSLDESLSVYQRGVELVKVCQTKLQAVEEQVKVLEGSLVAPYSSETET